MVRRKPLRYGVIHLKVLVTKIRKPIMHSNILWDTLSPLINVSSYRVRLLLFYHLTWVAMITTSLFKVCANVPTQETGLREGSVRFLDTS